MTRQQLGWAAKRLIFQAYIGFSLVTVVGGYVTAPLMTYYFFGDWRFWRHWNPGWRLLFHGWSMVYRIARSNGEHNFMFSVPLTSPPASAPNRNVVRRRQDWAFGSSCGTCHRCCELIDCPVLDERTGLCQGYDSFYWRYFNCGRYPSAQNEIDFYGCPKWELRPERPARAYAAPPVFAQTAEDR